MKIFYKTRTEQRNSPINGKRLDLGMNAAKRWAIQINVKKS